MQGRISSAKTEPIVHGIKELLLMQTKGKFLSPSERKRVLQHAEEVRRKRLKN